jgi:hypothetical protein
MIISVNKNSLYSTFSVENFQSLESAIDSMAPSLVEYYLSSFCEHNEDTIYLNKRDIEEKVSVGEYNLYLDYSENIYLELISSSEEIQTLSFW